mgnify:CR=1 FL=1
MRRNLGVWLPRYIHVVPPTVCEHTYRDTNTTLTPHVANLSIRKLHQVQYGSTATLFLTTLAGLAMFSLEDTPGSNTMRMVVAVLTMVLDIGFVVWCLIEAAKTSSGPIKRVYGKLVGCVTGTPPKPHQVQCVLPMVAGCSFLCTQAGGIAAVLLGLSLSVQGLVWTRCRLRAWFVCSKALRQEAGRLMQSTD